MMMDEDDFGMIEIVDVQLDEEQLLTNRLKNLFVANHMEFLNIVHSIVASTEEISKFKQQMKKMPTSIKTTFYNALYLKIAEIFDNALDGPDSKHYLKRIFQSILFDFIMLLERPRKVALCDKIFDQVLALTHSLTSIDKFKLMFKFALQISAYIDKKDKLQAFLNELHAFSIKQAPQFKILGINREEADQQKYMLIQLMAMDHLNSCHIQAYKPGQQEFLKIFETVYEKPYRSILEYGLKHYRLHSICKQFKQQILSTNIEVKDGVPTFIFNNCKIHKDLLKSKKIFDLAIDDADENIFRGLRKEHLIIDDKQMYFKYTPSMIKKMKAIIKNQTFNPKQQCLNNLIELVKTIVDNIDKKICYPYQPEKQVVEDPNPKNLLIQLFYVFSKYFMISERIIELDMQVMCQKLNETNLIQLLKLGDGWLHENPNQEQNVFYSLSLISFLAHLFIREEYGFIINYKSNVSQFIKKILLGIADFMNNWKTFKKIKIILERWGESAPQGCPQYALLIKKFFEFYFDQKTVVKNMGRNIFSPLLASRGYMIVAGTEASKKILDILETDIQTSSDKERSEKQLQKINTYLYKFSFFYLARMKLPSSDKVADHLFKLYQRYAHDLPMLYSFRTWILSHSNLSKNNFSPRSIKETLKQITVTHTIEFCKQLRQISVEKLLNMAEIPKQTQDYLEKVRTIINNLELKSQTETTELGTYDQLILILKEFNDLTAELHDKIVQFCKVNKSSQILEQNLFQKPKCLYHQLQRINQSFINVFRFYLCNLQKFVEPNDQVTLLKAVAKLFLPLSKDLKTISNKDLALINDILGFSPTKVETHLKKPQISRGGMGEDGNNQFLMNKENYIPINIIAVLYHEVRPIFVPIIKNLIAINEEGGGQRPSDPNAGSRTNQLYSIQEILLEIQFQESQQEVIQSNKAKARRKQSQRVLHNILFPSVNIFGPCYFNSKLEEKGKEEFAFGIFWNQFENLISDFDSNQIISLYNQLNMIFDACALKDCLITSKQNSNNPFRYRQGNEEARRIQEISRELQLMGISQQCTQIACRHIPNPDPDSVFEWIQANAQKIAIEQSKRENQQSYKNMMKMPEQQKQQLLSLNYNQFVKNVNKGTKQMIRKLFKQLYSEKGDRVKDIIFMCLNSFKDENYKNKRYGELTDKIFEELDNLNNQFSENKLSIIVGSLQNIISKRPNIIPRMHQKCITIKLLSFLQKSGKQETGQKILQVINKTLPTPTQKCSPGMVQYMSYICDILMNIQIKSDNISDILYKITKAQKSDLNMKILEIVCRGLGKGFIKHEIFSLLSIVLESDIKFATANIEFDIKSFIIENIDSEKLKGNILEIEAKKFAKSFLKFQNNPHLESVCSQLFLKRKNRPNLFYDKNAHNLFRSQILDSSFLSYELPTTQKIIVCSLVDLIVNCNSLEEQNRYIEQLYKTLQFYKILIPYCMNLQIGDSTFFEWLLEKQFKQGRGNVIHFITFLFVRNGLYLDKNTTFSDYLIAKLIMNFSQNAGYRQDKWMLLAITYLLQIKNFNEKSHIPISEQNCISLKNLLETEITENPQPVQRVILSEALYLIYQNQLIESLLNKYKINEQGQFTLQKQFLNMDLFYHKKNKKKNQLSDSRDDLDPFARRFGFLRQDRNGMILGLGGDDEDMFLEEDDIDGSGLLRHIMMRRASRQPQPSTNLRSVFIPRDDLVDDQAQQMMMVEQMMQQQIGGQLSVQQEMQIQEPINKVEKKEQKIIQEQVEVEARKIYLVEMIEKFKQILVKPQKASSSSQQKLPIIPSNNIKGEDLENQNYVVKVKEPRTSLNQKFSKTQIFKEKIAEIANIIDPQKKWALAYEEIKPSELPDLRPTDNNNMLRQHILSRLGLERERRQEGNSNEQLHMGRIFSALNEYEEPKPQEQQKKEEPKKEQNIQQQKIQIQGQQKVEVHQQPKQGEMIDEAQQQKSEKVVQQNQQKQGDQPEEKPQKKQEQPSQKKEQVLPQQPVIDEQNRPEKIEQQKPGEQVQEMIPAQIQQQLVMQQQQPPTRHRQILSMLGLQQNFLRNSGIDQQLFDSLPEDMQIEQLNHFISQQRASSQNNQNNENNQENGNRNPQPIVDIQSQNAAFIASLDPQLRAQTLMEATPDFLMTLPPQMRAEAENHRQRFIGRIIEEQQYEQGEQIYERDKNPKTIKYPSISEKGFKQINQKVAAQMAKNILIKFPKFNLSGIKILLQNKKTQGKAITTLISYARNITELNFSNLTYSQDKNQWVSEELLITGATRKDFMESLLESIYYAMTKCIYQDEKFLVGKFNYESYSLQKIPINENLHSDEEGYYPLYELLDLSIDNRFYALSAQLIKKVTDMPIVLKKKVIRGIHDEKFPDEFYKNLDGLSKDNEMKVLFEQQFPSSKSPKYQILSKILQYQFSRVPYLKKLHSQALETFKENPTTELTEFLSEIFRAYTIEDIKQLETIFLENKNTHFQIIKYLYSKGRVLDKQPIGIILQMPHLLDFQTKRFIFQNNPKLNRNRSRLMIQINRRNLFMESYNQIMSHTARELQHRIKIQFFDEPAEDAGGVKKQWFLEVSREIFNQEYALFQPSESGNTYQPNPKSYVNPEHLNYFKFIGRFTAKALQQGMLIDAFFTRSFYKMILGQQLTLKDLQQQDFNLYSSMKWLQSNQLNGDEYTFSYIYDYFGKMVTKELIPKGEQINVTEQNKAEYIEKYSLSIMRDSVQAQIDKFLQGFYQVLPKQYISYFEAKQLELLMSGMPSIDLKDLKANTQYAGYQVDDPQIIWYWEILEQYSSEELAHLIQFITGTSKIPLQGFSKIQGMNGVQRISIHKDCHTHQLPRSHTCFNQLDLPAYDSKQLMRERMRVAITWGSAGFGFM